MEDDAVVEPVPGQLARSSRRSSARRRQRARARSRPCWCESWQWTWPQTNGSTGGPLHRGRRSHSGEDDPRRLGVAADLEAAGVLEFAPQPRERLGRRARASSSPAMPRARSTWAVTRGSSATPGSAAMSSSAASKSSSSPRTASDSALIARAHGRRNGSPVERSSASSASPAPRSAWASTRSKCGFDPGSRRSSRSDASVSPRSVWMAATTPSIRPGRDWRARRPSMSVPRNTPRNRS